MARPEPPQTAPVSTGLADEDLLAERLVEEETGVPAVPIAEQVAANDVRVAEELAEAEGLAIEEGPPPAGLAFAGSGVEDGLAAADAAAAGVPAPSPEETDAAAADDLVLDAEDERYLRGHEPTRALPAEEMERLDDWDDQTAEEQENLPDNEQQG
ncbi:MAG TPA: hypothetical protein VF121_05420 [Thermoanaerobaculia bacterium]|nr:hypothetical protein [Thermoanaerobaculia bacterium]